MDGFFPKLGKALKDAGLLRIAKAVLRGTPAGGVIEVISEIGGIVNESSSDAAMAEAINSATPDQRVALMQIEMRQAEIESEERISQDENVTARHSADMLSDSWLSKNIRPVSLGVTLVFSLLFYLSFMILLVFGPEMGDNEMVVITDICSHLKELSFWFANFYVVGRSAEKVTAMGLGQKIASIFKKK